MGDFLLWTWVVGGTPLALVLTQRAVEWALSAVRARTIALGFAARERQASDRLLLWTHV